MTIAKKTILSVATLGLSLSIIGTASASTPISPIQGNSTIEGEITPYNLQKFYSEKIFYTKHEYLIPADIPTYKPKTFTDSSGVWAGRLTKTEVTESDNKNGWWVTYSGTVTLYK